MLTSSCLFHLRYLRLMRFCSLKGASGNLAHTSNSCYQTGMWQRNDILGLRLNDTVPSWCKFVWQAFGLLKEGRTGEANRLLSKFIIECPQQLERHDPRLFQCLYTSIMLFSLQFPQYAAELLKAFSLVSQDPLRRDPTHPLQPIILILSRIGPENMLHWGSRILFAYIDYISFWVGFGL